MLGLKSCPRCKGDILIDRDHLGWYEQCIRCGYQHDLKVLDEAKGYAKKDIREYSRQEGTRHGGGKVRCAI